MSLPHNRLSLLHTIQKPRPFLGQMISQRKFPSSIGYILKLFQVVLFEPCPQLLDGTGPFVCEIFSVFIEKLKLVVIISSLNIESSDRVQNVLLFF